MRKIGKLLAVALITAMSLEGAATVAMGNVSEISGKAEKEYKQSFSDVDKNYWAFEYIEDMAERKILSGYPGGIFLPEDNISRAEFARIIASASGLEVKSPEKMTFSDVTPTAWYAAYVETAKEFLDGYSIDGEMIFAPDSKALREDVAAAVVKIKGYDVTESNDFALDNKFSDSKEISGYTRKYIVAAVEQGLISGYPDGTFRPQDTVTRAEAAAILWQAIGREDDSEADATEPTVSPKPEKTPEPTVTPSTTPKPTATPTPDGYVERIPHSLETTLAVVQKEVNPVIFDGEDMDEVTVLYKGKSEQKLLFKEGVYAEAGLGVGDVFFFGTNRFGYVDEIFPIYDYSEDEFKHLISENWSCFLWDEGDDYQLAEGYITELDDSYMVLAPREAVENGYIDVNIEAKDDHENGVGVFAFEEDGLCYEFDAYNDNIYRVSDRFKCKKIVGAKESKFGKFEKNNGIFEGNLITKANYAVVIIEDGVVKEMYSIVK